MKDVFVNEHEVRLQLYDTKNCMLWTVLFCCGRAFDPLFVYPTAVHDSYFASSHNSGFLLFLMTGLA